MFFSVVYLNSPLSPPPADDTYTLTTAPLPLMGTVCGVEFDAITCLPTYLPPSRFGRNGLGTVWFGLVWSGSAWCRHDMVVSRLHIFHSNKIPSPRGQLTTYSG